MLSCANGKYSEPPDFTTDYLELCLPSLLLVYENKFSEAQLRKMRSDLRKALSIKNDGILAIYFLGLAYEKSNRPKDAELNFNNALELDSDFFPAMLGNARVSKSVTADNSIILIFNDLLLRYPKNSMIMRQLAEAYYERSEWQNAKELFAKVLDNGQKNSDIVLKLARCEIELKNYIRAQMLFDTFNTENIATRNSRFFTSRLQYEGFKNSGSALKILHSLNEENPSDYEVLLYLTKVLLLSQNKTEQEEGRIRLENLLALEDDAIVNIAVDIYELAAADAIERKAWSTARTYMQKILPLRRGETELLNAFYAERGLKNKWAALTLSRELRAKFPQNEEGNIAYAEALIDNERNAEALAFIDGRIGVSSGGNYKSRYYFLRSTLKEGDAALSDLRLSIFENPRNVDSLKSVFLFHIKSGDDAQAVYYLRQAIALSPDDPEIIKYQRQYAEKF
ncbi:MAG: hypothetical protein Ta2G_19640 [Termitinemataceae bacterium]|nr:MAG: hypothetical protein Ta2G_19640 [Termitinemataceae bacterium]